MKNGIKNTVASLISKTISIILGLLIPRLVLVNLGSEANGLLTSVTGALSYLSILESGIGLASLQALYRPVSTQDKASVNAILSATNFYYNRIGKIYLAVVFVISGVYSLTVTTSIPRLTVFLVFLCSGISGAISYFLSGKYSLLLKAEGKSYVYTLLSTVFYVLERVAKILILAFGKNILLLQFSLLLITALQNIVFCCYVKKKYPWVDVDVTADFQATSQRGAVLIHKLSGLFFSSTDVLLLTYIVNLTAVSLYNMYSLFYGMLKSVAVSFADSFIHVLGQNYKDKKHFIRLFDVYEVYNMAIVFAVFCVGYMLTLPFMRLYTAGVSDINYIDGTICLLFAIYYLVENGRKASMVVIEIAEKFEETKWHSVIEAGINLTVSLLLTFRFRIYGVLLGTIAGLLYRTIVAVNYASSLLDRSPWVSLLRWVRNAATFVVIALIESYINIDLSTYIRLIMYGVALATVTLTIFVAVNSAFDPEVAKYLFTYLKTKTNRIRIFRKSSS